MEDSNNYLDNENKVDNKKKIIFMIIGLVIMLILVIGSTYAYFSVDVNESENKPTNITATTGKIGNATLIGLNSKLFLNVSAEDMAETNAGKTYWATTDSEEGRIVNDEVQSHKIAEVKIDGGEENTNYVCSADVVVTANGNMMEEVYNSGNDENELVFNLSSTTLNSTTDFYYDELSSKTIKWNFKIQGNNTAELNTYLKLYNSEEEQAYLAGKNLEINIETKNLKCEVYEPYENATKLQLASGGYPKGLSDTPVGGMYRFQGEQGTVDNYLCFDKKCTNESEDMYRIIGVTKEGNIKVIKQMSIGDMAWHNDSENDTQWPNSDLYKYLNSNAEGFYNTLDSSIKDKIEKVNWKYGDIQYEEANTIGISIYEIENKWEQVIDAFIGLIYLHDYYLATSNYANCNDYNNGGYLECPKSWIYMINNGDNNWEWTMSRFGYISRNDSYSAWSVTSDDDIETNFLDNVVAVRPVFYLKDDTVISSGTGAVDDPFIIN